MLRHRYEYLVAMHHSILPNYVLPADHAVVRGKKKGEKKRERLVRDLELLLEFTGQKALEMGFPSILVC